MPHLRQYGLAVLVGANVNSKVERPVRRRKVLIVSRCAWTLYTFRRGLIEFLKSKDVDIHVAGWGGDGHAERVRSLGIRFHDIPVSLSSISPLRDLKLVYTLVQLYRTVDADVVHHFTVKPVIYGSLASRLIRRHCVVNTITGLGYAYTNAPRWLTTVVSALYRLALRKSDYNFFQNEDDQVLFEDRRIVARGKTHVVPGSGVDVTFFHPKYRNATERASINVLFVGRLLIDKGIREYISAAIKLRGAGENIEFLALGDLDARNPSCLSEREFEVARASNAIQWIGRTDDVRQYLADADIVVLPSYREGVPRSLLEAAAMGVAIIASDVPGCRQVVEHNVNGLLVAPRDADALAAAIRRLSLDHKERVRFGVAGREKVLSEFDENIVCEKTWQAYQECRNW